ncbi:MAG: hypothetical protein OXD32_00090 [Endozoicomonadaceae bacterium]|nr:hypothetical protein [Endozoicomonadaceae bacterium]
MKTFVILLQLSLFLCYMAESHAYKKKHHNKVYFTGVAHSVNFKMSTHCITSKQPFNNPTWLKTVKIKKKIGLDIIAGRHGSGIEHGGTVNCTYKSMAHDLPTFFVGSFTYKKIPWTLNFSVEGTLFVNGMSFNNIVLAQGNHSSTNDWWFGGKSCVVADSMMDAVNCKSDTGYTWCFVRGKIHNPTMLYTAPNEIKVFTHKCSFYSDT